MTQEEIKEEYHKCIESFEYWRDHYFLRKKTLEDWTEVIISMKNEFGISLRETMDMYKSDRQKWVDWYNDKLLNNTK